MSGGHGSEPGPGPGVGPAPERRTERRTPPRVEALLERMTLEEKVGQMTQLTIGAVAADDSPRSGEIRLDRGKLREALAERHVGSLLNILEGSLTVDGWRAAIEEVQAAAASTRLGIPVLYGIDHVHGANYIRGGTIFPHNLALAASYDRELVEAIGEATGRETLEAAIPWNFAPVLDVGRQPLWPRFYETFGEAAWLAGELGAATIRGLRSAGVAATGKHFLAYSGPALGRDRTPAPLGRRTVREQFLPPFRRAVAEGVEAIMVNSGEIDGEPVHASRYWLTDVLRGELGFDGVVVTDWADIAFLHTRHRVAPDLESATRMAVEAGIDMAMTPDNYDFHDRLVALVRAGTLPESRVDASVRRILTLKARLGLFERPVPDAPDVDRGAHRSLALEAARASVILLRNHGVLPLDPGARLLVTGPAAGSLSALNGGWTHTWQGEDPGAFEPDAPTLVDEIAARAGHVEHILGAGFDGREDVHAAVAAAREADIALVALGEDGYSEWAGDLRDLSLPDAQLRLARAVMDTGTPTILVLLEGRPRLIRPIADDAAAILLASWPGMTGARAVAEVLFGDVNPSGRLPFTYPRHANDLTPHDHKYTASLGPRLEPRAPDGFQPQFELGEGLSYTTFEYHDLQLDPPELGPGYTLQVRLRVRNTGDRAGRHSVLVFARQHYSRWTPHVRRLCAARPIELEPGEARSVSFQLAADAFAAVGRDGESVLEPGDFDIMVGDLTDTFHLKGAG